MRVVRSSAREQPSGSPFRQGMKALRRQGDRESRTDATTPAPAEIATRLGIAEGASLLGIRKGNSGARQGAGVAEAPDHTYWSGASRLRWVWDLNPR
ncbi:hypothetical protein GCM10010264_33330 [Streptomyces globisporus]|nr:hypothetical protein GCM10010264_33330 [Streptomyces globisporus]